MNSLRSLLLALALVAPPAFAESPEPARTLFTNVNVFDGTSAKLAMGQSVLVQGNLIEQVSPKALIDEDTTVPKE